MEARKEVAPMLEREEKKPDAGELSGSELEQVTEFDVETERTHMVQDKRAQLATEYETLRKPLLELKNADDKGSRAEYERVRSQFLKQVVELYARGSIERSKDISDLAAANIKGRSGDYFMIGVEALVDTVTAMDDFNNRFNMLVEHRPEGEDALHYLEKLIPEFYENVKKSAIQKNEQLDGTEAGKQEVQDALRTAFDGIKEMNRDGTDPTTPRQVRVPKKKGWFSKLFGRK